MEHGAVLVYTTCVKCSNLVCGILIAWPSSSNYISRLRAQKLLHAVSHGLHVDCNVSDDGFPVHNYYVDGLIITASTPANKT